MVWFGTCTIWLQLIFMLEKLNSAENEDTEVDKLMESFSGLLRPIAKPFQESYEVSKNRKERQCGLREKPTHIIMQNRITEYSATSIRLGLTLLDFTQCSTIVVRE